MDDADGEIRVADIDVDDLAIDARKRVDRLDLFGGDVGRGLRILRQGRGRK